MSQTSQAPIGVQAFVDAQALNRYHWLVFGLCALCLIFDGFDAQAMGYVAPALRESLGLPATSLGPIFSASLFGMLIGALGLGILADRIGRRPVLIGALAFCGAMMCATAYVQTGPQLLAMRFVTGLGLGTLLPTALAMTSEFSPGRNRATITMLMSLGFVSGAAIGGAIASFVIPHLGWQGVFTLAGGASLVTALVMFRWMPESIQFLASTEGGSFKYTTRVARALSRNPAMAEQTWFNEKSIEKNLQQTAAGTSASGEVEVKRGWSQLFKNGFAVTTFMLWMLNFANLLDLYFLSNWLPTLLKESGLPLKTAMIGSAVLQSGGIPATILLSLLSKRIKLTHLLIGNFIIGAIAMTVIGVSVTSSVPLLFVAIFFAGFCVVGGQSGVNAMGAYCYPTAMRTTGMGWANGIGRFGSVAGPIVGGALLALGWGVHVVFFGAALAGVFSITALFFLGFGRAGVRQK
ncbi:MAG TPA: MFS transporter [Herbaspirillum sp.]|jgi:AAHS family 4-hydroxybenzoate transporter-like MFS transporter